MATAFESIDAHRIAANGLGLERMANRRALVDHLDMRVLERGQVGLRVVTGRFDDLDAAFDDRPDIAGIVGDVTVGRKVRFTPNGLSVISRQRRISAARSAGDRWVRPVMMPEATGVGDGRRQLRVPDVMHAAP